MQITLNDQLCVNTLRFLSVDQIEKANSGHPGLPLGAAPMAYALWSRHLRFNPSNPSWMNRDRFVLSAGHGSALLYSLLHVFGYDLAIDDLKNFRQMGSKTPGHPEYGFTAGVEATTGPLGQGLGMAVGMAVAKEYLAATYGDIIDYNVYALVSDGDLMEGIGAESASLAGHLKLGRLIALYDDNDISLDGPTSLAFTEDVGAKHEAMGWHVQRIADGNDVEAISAAIDAAKADPRPSLIMVKTVIGFGSSKAGTSSAHGSPLGKDVTAKTRETLGWPAEPAFHVPAEVGAVKTAFQQRGEELENAWKSKLSGLSADVQSQLGHIVNRTLPEGWDKDIKALTVDGGQATRDSGKTALNAIAKNIPWIVGGSADLVSSTKTEVSGSPAFSADNRGGRNIWFGVREHAMGAIVNGMALSGLIPFGSTFLVFSDYMRGSIRLSSLMQVPSVWVFTHDSICVGEDGPTHEPIEQVPSLRLIPGLKVYRPADPKETFACWQNAVERGEPSCLILTRQKLPLVAADSVFEDVKKGGYVLVDAENPDVVLLATGSEVGLAKDAAAQLSSEGITTRVVSMPSVELFRDMDIEYQNSVLPPSVPVVAIEAGATAGWYEFTGSEGLVIGLDRFGESGPFEVIYPHLGFNAARIVTDVKDLVGR